MAKCDCWANPMPDYCTGEAEWLAFWPGCEYCGGSECYDFDEWEAFCTGCATRYLRFAVGEKRSPYLGRQYRIKPHDDNAEPVWYHGDDLPEWASPEPDG